MPHHRGGSSQDRRRARRAASRLATAPPAIEIPADELAEIRQLALAAAPAAPEDRALERLDASLRAGTATLRLIFPQAAVDEASAFLASRVRIAEEGEMSADLGAAVRARLEPFVRGLEAELTAAQENLPEGTMRFNLVDVVVASAEPLPDELAPGERLPEANPSPEPPEATQAARGPLSWTSLFVPEGTLTDDRRAFQPGSLEWRELPLTLMAMIETSEGGHVGAQVSGRIDRIWRDGNDIRAAGVFDEGEYGTDIARMVADGTLRGLSVDIAIHEYEVGPKSDYFDADGHWLAEKPEPTAEAEPTLDDLLFGAETEEPIFVVTKGVIGMATVCPFPAFAEANIALAASGAIWSYAHQAGFVVVEAKDALLAAAALEGLAPDGTPDLDEIDEPLTASAAGLAPLKPPAEWFRRPDELAELTPMTLTEDGRIYGHAWGWGTCHTAIPDVCTTAPRSAAAYGYYLLKQVECEAGELVDVGTVTLDTGHATLQMGRLEAIRHYDDTGTAVADVVVGEDEFGGWFSGAVRPDADAETVRKLRGATLSGDWRPVNGNRELIALLAVNVPGFPVPRVRALVASGADEPEVLALTAAGVVRPEASDDELFVIGLAAAERLGEITHDEIRALSGGVIADDFRLRMIGAARAELAERADERDLRQIEALAEAARGTFSDLAAAARA